jgi:asparagine synthase (glutamine-hydrolysing)
MAAAQTHRGPDDGGLFQDARVVLGHRRLAIIDLSPTGHQPMSNEDGTIWVTFGRGWRAWMLAVIGAGK